MFKGKRFARGMLAMSGGHTPSVGTAICWLMLVAISYSPRSLSSDDRPALR